MTNGLAAAPAAIALKLIDLLLAEQLTESAEVALPRVPASAFPGLLGQHYHDAESGCLMRFAEVAGFLSLALHGNHAVPLRKRGESTAWLGVLDMATSAFEVELAGVDAAQAPDRLEVRDGGRVQHFQRLPDTVPAAASFAPQLCGSYRSADLDAEAQIAFDGTNLKLTVQGRHGQLRFRLQPVSDAVLQIFPTDPLLATLANSNVLNLDRQGERVIGLRIDSTRTRHMRFTREEQSA